MHLRPPRIRKDPGFFIDIFTIILYIISMENETLGFGVHAKLLWTRVPVSYLSWMIRVNHTKAEQAQKELNRRGTCTPTLDISGHAIDRASLHFFHIWKTTSRHQEGLHAWLVRRCQEALENKQADSEGVIVYNGIKFVFEFLGNWPSLKTVMPATHRVRSDREIASIAYSMKQKELYPST